MTVAGFGAGLPFVTRQPVFRLDGPVEGYELVVRAAGEGEAGPGESFPQWFGGFDRLVGTATAFVRVPASGLAWTGFRDAVDSRRVVLGLPAEVDRDPELEARVRALAEAGFRMWSPEPVAPGSGVRAELASVVSVPFQRPRAEVEADVLPWKDREARVMALEVEEPQQHEWAREWAVPLVQGFHYLRTEALSREDLSVESLGIMRLLQLLRDYDTTDTAVEEAFRADPELSYRLLRMINSAALGGRGVQSIGHALRILGRDPLYRWLSQLLLVASPDDDRRREVVKSALLRGRMCELLGEHLRSPVGGAGLSADLLFLVGMFSRLDALLGAPIPELVERVDLPGEARRALLSREGPGGGVLAVVEAYESGDWDRADAALEAMGLKAEGIPDLYLDAFTWAGSRLALHDRS